MSLNFCIKSLLFLGYEFQPGGKKGHVIHNKIFASKSLLSLGHTLKRNEELTKMSYFLKHQN